ncbi:MAG TPA: alpha/beta hydrolase [Solimonas sp.]|nr:alpha/beta hydrolase [Solimonas sp.]
MPRLLIALFASLLLGACSGQYLLNRLTPDEGEKYLVDYDQIYDAATAQRLDVYHPRGAAKAPVVVFFYGGRWSGGDKAEFKFVGQALASRGFVALLANYRLYPEVRFPAFVEDGARAVKWARANAKRYGGDPAQLFVMGHSSGAHIAAMLALNGEYLKAVGGSRAWLKGMIGLAGPYDFMPITAPDLRDIFGPVDRFPQSQPIFFVDGKNPPLLLMHGEDDDAVWVKNTRNLAASVKRAGGPVDTIIYPSLSHTMILGSMASLLRGRADVLDQVESFILRVAKARPRAESEIKGRAVAPEDRIEGTILPEPAPIEAVPLPEPGADAPPPATVAP